MTGTENEWIREMLGPACTDERIEAGPGGEQYLTMSPEEFRAAAEALSIHSFALIGLFAAEGFSTTSPFSIFSIFAKNGRILVLIREAGSEVLSLAGLFASASWFEREVTDGFGIRFACASDTRRLFLHECYPDDFHPLKKSVPNAPPGEAPTLPPGRMYLFRQVKGDSVYQVPVGPVHAGVIEPGHFRFSVIGETIFNLEIRMFWKHRGIEKLAEGRKPADCLPVAEAVSGDETVANATGFCTAVERIAGIRVPDRAWYIRTILLELERISAHLADQAGMLIDVAFPLGANQFSVLREECVRMQEQLTGSRFMRGSICIGGVSRDCRAEDLSALAAFIRDLRKRYRVGLRIVLSTTSVIDRFATTGVVKRSLILPLNLTGPVARASGSAGDVRAENPYGVYGRYKPPVHPLYDGDVLSRFTLKATEIADSISMIERLIAEIPGGEVRSTDPVRDGYALALVESPRGQNLCWVRIAEGKIDRYKVRTASFCNWQAIEHAAQGNIIADFPVINKSMNLSYAGTDL